MGTSSCLSTAAAAICRSEVTLRRWLPDRGLAGQELAALSVPVGDGMGLVKLDSGSGMLILSGARGRGRWCGAS